MVFRITDDTAAPDPAALPAIGALLAALPPPLPPPPPPDPALDPIDAAVAAEAVAYGALRATCAAPGWGRRRRKGGPSSAH